MPVASCPLTRPIRPFNLGTQIRFFALSLTLMPPSRLGTTRQKAFSHKVRTGCITCKLRRVKCDESKPNCLNCTRGNRQCLGYAIPIAKVFTLESRKTSSTERPSSIQSSQGASCNDELLLSKTLGLPFGTNEEARSLQHWLLLTAPVLAHYGPQGDFYTVLVPQIALQSPAVKHMLVALSMTHEKFHTGVATATPKMNSQAVSHYISAIAEIRNNNPPKLHVVIASLVAWVIELFQNNLPGAVVHLRGTLKLLREYKRSKPPGSAADVLRKSILPTSSLAKGLTQLMIHTGPIPGEIEPEYRGHICYPWGGQAFSSFAEGRSAICHYIEELADSGSGCNIREIEKLLGHWFEPARRWDQETIPTSALTALLLLFNLALALLPSSDVAGFSYSINPRTVDFVVDRAAVLANIHQKIEPRNEDLRQTLVIVLNFVVRLFPDSSSHGRASLLLRQLRGQG
ncbi:Fungal specific transcription factor domain-containing protein [Cladophialophora immunda]|nr:Fungal specific transcription factor domain-containing protein [Cladophialophora immunda]